MRAVLLDTGVIVALLDRSERHHKRCASLVSSLDAQFVTCEAVIAEACYLTRRIPGASEAILQNVAAAVFHIPLQLRTCADSIQRILRKYRGQAVDLADACLIQLASELGTGEILTLDRDFLVYRWGTNKPFVSLMSTSVPPPV